MKRISRLTALLLALLLIFQMTAVATEMSSEDIYVEPTPIPQENLDADILMQLSNDAAEVAAAIDTVRGMGVTANQDLIPLRNYPNLIWGEKIAELPAGTFVVVYDTMGSGIISGDWYKVCYNGQDGYIHSSLLNVCKCDAEDSVGLEVHYETCPDKMYYTAVCTLTAAEIYAGWDSYMEAGKEFIKGYLEQNDPAKLAELNGLLYMATVPVCDCGNNESPIISHADRCSLKKHYMALCELTAAEIYAKWSFYPVDAKEYILTYLSWNHEWAEKLAELQALIDNKVGIVLQGVKIQMEGDLPEDAQVFAETVSENVLDYLMENAPSSRAESAHGAYYALDMKIFSEGTEWQPEEGKPVTVTLTDLFPGATDVQVYHIHDTKALEEAANGGEAPVMKQIQNVSFNENGDVSFEADGFSVYYVKATYGAEYFYITVGRAHSATTVFTGIGYTLPEDVTVSSGSVKIGSTTYNGTNSNHVTNLKEKGITLTSSGKTINISTTFTGSATWTLTLSNGTKVTITLSGKTLLDIKDVSTLGKSSISKYTGAAADNITIKLFNYGSDINSRIGGKLDYIFKQGNYSNRLVDGYTMWNVDKQAEYNAYRASILDGYVKQYGETEGGNRATDDAQNYIYNKYKVCVDGYFDAATEYGAGYGAVNGTDYYASAPMDIIATAAGLPLSTDNKLNLAGLFNGDFAKEQYTINGNTGLFWKEGEYYIYDSAKRAAFLENGKFQLYNGVTRPWYTAELPDTDAPHSQTLYTSQIPTGKEKAINVNYTWRSAEGNNAVQNGNFLPFNKASEMRQDIGPQVDANQSVILNPDLWFGLSMEFDFFMPKNGQVGGDNMVYQFLGDDDVWVYIDDVLVLNIGGTHSPYTGTIDFATGAVQYMYDHPTTTEKVTVNTTLYELFKAASAKYPSRVNMNDFNNPNGESVFKDYSMHNMKFYYMERGGNISYCSMKFNMDPLPENSLLVYKEVEGATEFTEDREYAFEIVDTKPQTGDSTIVANHAYTLTEADGSTQTLNTDAKGQFVLKEGESAQFLFEGHYSDTTFRVTELTDTYVQHVVFPDGGETPDATDGNTATVTIAPSGTAQKIGFLNVLKSTNVTVEKEVVSTLGTDANVEFNFEAMVYLDEEKKQVYKLASSENYSVDGGGKITFSLKNGESIDIGPIPYHAKMVVTEVGTNDILVPLERFDTAFTATYSDVTGGDTTVFEGFVDPQAYGNTDAVPVITFTNTRKYFPMTISKSGLDMELDDNSSTVYRIEGNDVDMIVSINGNSDVTVNDLPSGNYVVTELTDWSWRYTSTSNRENNTVLVDGTDDTIHFTNTRNMIYWLDGEAVAKENQFGDTTGN